MSKKLEIVIDKGEPLSFLHIHSILRRPFQDFIKENIERDEIDVKDHPFKNIPVKRHVSKKNYIVTITIEEDTII